MKDDYLDCVVLDQCKFNGDAWSFVSDSQEVAAIKSYVGEIANEFDSFFVKVEDGDYSEVWGIHGIIPHTSKNAYQIR